MNNKICFITNYASHYHLSKWKLMAETFDVDFVFDHDITKTKGIKQIDLSQVKAETFNVKNYFICGHMIWQSGVIKLALKKKYDKYIVTDEMTCLSYWVFAIIILFNRNKKLYWGDGHGWYGREGLLKRIIKKTAFNISDGEFVYGNYARDIMINNGLNGNKIWVVHNSLNHSEQLKYRGNITDIYKKHFNNDNPVLIFIGRLIKTKRLDMMLSAMENMKAQGLECNCVFIGDGETKDELKGITKQKNLNNNVWFYGACYSEEELSELISNADLCVSPGNIGLTAMHSLTYGTPVITSDDFKHQGPEFESIKVGLTGDFFNVGDIDNLSEKIMSWLKTRINRQKIREDCYREIDNNWTPEFKVNIFKQVLFKSYLK